MSSGTIKLGAVAPWTATGAGPTITPAREMLNVWAAYVNAHGGICGRQIDLLVRDDQGSASQTAAQYRDLVENQKVAAFVFAFTVLTLSAFEPYVEQQQIPILGGDMLTGVWNRSPVFFPSGASATENLYGLYRAVQGQPNGKNVAILYCIEVVTCSDSYNFQVRTHLPDIVGSHIVYAKQVSLTQISFAAECQAAQKAGAGAIFAYGDGSFVERIANSCAQQGIRMAYMVSGTAATTDLARNPYLSGTAYTDTQTQPWLANDTAGAKLYQQLTSQYNVPRSGSSMQAFTSVLLAQQVLTLLGGQPVTPASILHTARTQITNFTAGGLIGAETFDAGAQPQTQCTGTAEVESGQWQMVDDGALTCRNGTPGPLPTP
jgi:ABC-type branched-subunit amino acid transport system substrate-binding protein